MTGMEKTEKMRVSFWIRRGCVDVHQVPNDAEGEDDDGQDVRPVVRAAKDLGHAFVSVF
jgi:hypothetical protein